MKVRNEDKLLVGAIIFFATALVASTVYGIVNIFM